MRWPQQQTLREQLATARSATSEANQRAHDLQARLEEATDTATAAQASLESERGRVAALRAQMAQAEQGAASVVAQLEEAADDARASAAAARQQLAVAETRARALEDDVAAARRDASSAQGRVQRLERDLKAARKAADDRSRQLQELQAKVPSPASTKQRDKAHAARVEALHRQVSSARDEAQAAADARALAEQRAQQQVCHRAPAGLTAHA